MLLYDIDGCWGGGVVIQGTRKVFRESKALRERVREYGSKVSLISVYGLKKRSDSEVKYANPPQYSEVDCTYSITIKYW